jgi:type III restriction enzyme
VALGNRGVEEARIGDYLAGGLVHVDHASYEDRTSQLHDPSAQVVAHFRRCPAKDDTRGVPRCYRRPMVQFVHAQMQACFWGNAVGRDVVASKGLTGPKPSAYTASKSEPALDLRQSPADKSNMARYPFGGLARCP